MAFTLPPLPYDYDALEPHIDEQTMQIHHDKHHAAYVNNLNAALEAHPDLQKKTLEELIANLDAVPEGDPHGGAQQRRRPRQPHDVLGDHGAGRREGAGGRARGRDRRRASADSTQFKEQFAKAGVGRFGSGWAWLIADQGGKLEIDSTPNQDTPLMEGKHADPGLRRVGARVLPEVSEPAARLPQRLVERRQLDRHRSAVRQGERRVSSMASPSVPAQKGLPPVGSPAPDFTLPSTADADVTLSKLRGRNVLLAFFPLAFTGTCTREMAAFTEDDAQFQSAETVVLPISVDSVPTLKEFKSKERITVDLLSDFKRDVSRQYGTLLEERFFSNRAYVLIDKDGVVRWTFMEDTPGTRRENAELLEHLRALR